MTEQENQTILQEFFTKSLSLAISDENVHQGMLKFYMKKN